MPEELDEGILRDLLRPAVVVQDQADRPQDGRELRTEKAA
jgi:hypothetical protein